MYSPSEIEKFLLRKTDSWDFIKDVGEKDLIEQIHELGGNSFKTIPFVHQLASFLLGIHKESFLYHLFPGSGKSKLSLDMLNYLFTNKKASRALILVPYTITIESWADQIKEHSNFTYLPLLGTTKQRWELLKNVNDYDIVGLSYPGLTAMIPYSTTKIKNRKTILLDYTKLNEFSNYFDSIIYDECFAKNSLVNTPMGVKKIQEFNIGDLVYNLNGIDKVTKIFITKVKLSNIVKVTLSNNKIIFCSKNHIFFTEDGEIKAELLKNKLISSLKTDNIGSKEGRKIERVRVESAEIYQPGGNEESFSSIITDTERNQQFVEFYDLEIETHPSYNIENIPVHNCHTVKGYDSIIFNICKYLSNKYKYRYGLTGTPTSRNLEDLWSQFYLIDCGETLGKTISFYRQAFFEKKKNYWGGYDYKINKEKKALLMKIIKNSSIAYKDTEVLDLPEKINIKKHINIAKQQNDFYKKAVDGIIEAKGDITLLENSFIKLRQITSGFVNFVSNEGDSVKIIFDENPKLNALLSILEEIGEEKLVVFNEYTITGDIICSRLEQEKIGYERLYGDTEDKYETMQRFLNEKDCRVYVVNSKSGAMSLNLQKAHYQVYFESPVSPITREQSECRLFRLGQKHRVFIYDFIIKNTIDEKILGFIAEGKDIYKEIFKDYKILI